MATYVLPSPGDTNWGTVLNAAINAINADLATKASRTSPTISNATFTGTTSGITKSMVGLSAVDNTSDANKPVSTAQQAALNNKATLTDATVTFTGTVMHDTPAATDNSTRSATTQWVRTYVSSVNTGGSTYTRTLAMPVVVIWNTTTGTWQHRGATITARPADMITGDIILFTGNPGGTLPAWRADNDIWVQG